MLEDLQELTHGIHNVVGVQCGHPGHMVGVAEALRVKEGQDHLLAPDGLHLGLDEARLAVSQWKDAVDLSW